jgi:hypothetical protein
MSGQNQAIFANNSVALKSFKSTLSESRFARYSNASNGDEEKAIELYHWNARLSQAMYLPLQMWEVGLRNKLNTFLQWKYSQDWPNTLPSKRVLTNNELRRLSETIERQKQHRNLTSVPTGAVVADLSAGFWVALLGARYDLAFSWRYNLQRIFPQDPKLKRDVAWEICDDLLDLRNRVAHHEPIYTLPIEEWRADLDYLLGAMCPGAQLYSRVTCIFPDVWKLRPAWLPAPKPPASPPAPASPPSSATT